MKSNVFKIILFIIITALFTTTGCDKTVKTTESTTTSSTTTTTTQTTPTTTIPTTTTTTEETPSLTTAITTPTQTTSSTTTTMTTSPTTSSTTTVTSTSATTTSTTVPATTISSEPVEFAEITVEELKILLDKGVETAEWAYIVVDIRLNDEFSESHIQHSVNIEPNILGIESIENYINSELADLAKDKLIVFCGNTDEESREMAQRLMDLDAGHDAANVKILKGGIQVWFDAGYPTMTGDS